MKIGIFGSSLGEMSDDIRTKARQLGKEIAIRGHTIITGGCYGLPHEVVVGAKEKGGKTISVSPGMNLEEHKTIHGYPTEGYDEFIFVPSNYELKHDIRSRFKYRNITSTHKCDAGIIIRGAIGTLNEFTNLYDSGKNIGVLTGTGGATEFIKKMVENFKKPSKSKMVYDSDPAKLVEKLENLG